MSEEKKEPKLIDLTEAFTVLKNGGKVREKHHKEGIYYLIRDKNDDPCIKEPTVFIHTLDGQLCRTPLPSQNDPTQKVFQEVK